MSDLTVLARARGLDGLVPHLGALGLGPPAADGPELVAPPASDPLGALGQMRRRGLEPALVDVVWRWLEPRPLEAGLFAWDVLCGAILEPERDRLLVERLRRAAHRVADVLPEPGRAFALSSRVDPGTLVTRVAMPAFDALDDGARVAQAQQAALAAVEMVRVVSPPDDPQLAALAGGARHLARLFQLAHLPTLATFHFEYLWRTVGRREAFADWVEALLDADAHGHLPTREQLITTGSADELELVGYLLARNAAQLGAPAAMLREFKNAPNPLDYAGDPKTLARAWQRSHLSYAELALDESETPVPLAVLDEVVRLEPEWRYAARVQLAVTALVSPPQSPAPLARLDAFLARFGNERWAWAELDQATAVEASWVRPTFARLAREIVRLPHDRAAWEAAGVVRLPSDDAEAWLDVLAARAAAQCAL